MTKFIHFFALLLLSISSVAQFHIKVTCNPDNDGNTNLVYMHDDWKDSFILNDQLTDSAISKERLIQALEKLAGQIKKDYPSASVVLLSLVSAMYIKKDDILAEKVMDETGKLILQYNKELNKGKTSHN